MINSTKISNTILRDQNLTLKSKGLYASLAYFFSIPDFNFTQKTIKTLCKNGEDSITSALIELKQNGYLKIKKATNYTTGEFAYAYTLLSEPNLATEPNTYTSENIGNLKNAYIAPLNKFTFTPNEIIKDITVNLEHKGVYSLFALFKNNGDDKAHISLDYIRSLSKNGKRAFDRIFKELKQTSYIIQNKICAGKFRYEYIVSTVKHITENVVNIISSNPSHKLIEKTKQTIATNIISYTGEHREYLTTTIIDAIESTKGIRVNKKYITYKKMVQAFLKLRSEHLQIVSTIMLKSKVKNNQAYILACLYNSLSQKIPQASTVETPLEPWEIEMIKGFKNK